MTTNAKSWLVWISASAIVVMVARNPMYTLIILSVALLTMAVFERQEREERLPLMRLALIFLLVSATYNALFVHEGETVIFQVPPLPLVGGPVTLEAIVEGAANGLTLLTLLTVFATLSAIVPTSELTRLLPGAFRDLGLVLMIAINYIPETRRHLQRIREAQAIRGHQVRGLKDWRPLVVPLLVGGLERAMRLSETMVARGYGSTSDADSRPAERAMLIIGLLAAVGGWFLILWRGWPGWLLLLPGTLAVAFIIWRRGRPAKRTAYRPQSWRILDYLLLCSAIFALVAVMFPWPFLDGATLFFVAYPSLTLPSFDPLIGLALALLALPALVVVLVGES